MAKYQPKKNQKQKPDKKRQGGGHGKTLKFYKAAHLEGRAGPLI